MNNKRLRGNLLVLLFVIWGLCSCKQKSVESSDSIIYTCSMDPQVKQDKPGKCPICKMDLTPVRKSQQAGDSHDLHLTDTQLRLANINTDTVKMRLFYDEKTLTGVTVEDRSKVEVISAKVSGRIDRLYFQNTGEKLQAGDKLYDLYSEDLLAAIKDYLLTIDKQEGAAKTFNFSPFILAAKNKLILWGLSERQIEKLSLRDVKNTIPIYSKVSGVLSTIAVKEGDTIEEGTELFQLSDFNTIWVEAQTYAQDFQNKGDQKEAEVVIAAYPEIVYKGNNLFINPEFAGNSKINLIRIKIENTGGKVKPGMMAYIQFRTRGASILAVPSEAVLRNEKSATVWVKNNKGNFEVRMVTIGAENKKYVEIISGLKEGEILVTSGAYLLNSEYILKKGADPMAGMKM